MNVEEVIAAIATTDQRVQELFTHLVERDLTDSPYNEEWTFRDVLAHMVWYEEEMAAIVNDQSILDSDPIWNNPLDTRNQLIHESMAGVTPPDLLRRHQIASKQLRQGLELLDDPHMEDAALFAGMPEHWVPWQIIAGSSFDHNQEHLEQIQQLLHQD